MSDEACAAAAAGAAYLALAALVGMCSSAISSSAHMLRWLLQDDAAVDVMMPQANAQHSRPHSRSLKNVMYTTLLVSNQRSVCSETEADVSAKQER